MPRTAAQLAKRLLEQDNDLYGALRAVQDGDASWTEKFGAPDLRAYLAELVSLVAELEREGF